MVTKLLITFKNFSYENKSQIYSSNSYNATHELF